MHIEIMVNGKPYELQISAREIINDGRTYALLSDSETEELVQNIHILNDTDIEIIKDALDCMYEALRSEIKYAVGDQDIIEADESRLNDLDALYEKMCL